MEVYREDGSPPSAVFLAKIRAMQTLNAMRDAPDGFDRAEGVIRELLHSVIPALEEELSDYRAPIPPDSTFFLAVPESFVAGARYASETEAHTKALDQVEQKDHRKVYVLQAVSCVERQGIRIARLGTPRTPESETPAGTDTEEYLDDDYVDGEDAEEERSSNRERFKRLGMG